MIGDTVGYVLELLGYADSSGLVTPDGADTSPERSYVWDEAREKFAIDAVYFHGDIPIIYFRGFEAASDAELAELHRHLWNHNRVPLLVAIRPEDIRVYDCFSPPTRAADGTITSDGALLRAIHLAADAVTLRRALAGFDREEVELRGLKPVGVQTARERRVDQRLLANLALVRRRLTDAGLAEHIVNSLIGRSIFVRYLEDRNVLTPQFLVEQYGAASYAELLVNSSDGAYALFRFLGDKFNGDLFPIGPDERAAVTADHLRLLGAFLSGTDVSTGQMYFWAYDFEYIPIELISSIYEEFLHEARASTGAYYTPKEIVDFVLTSALSASTTSGGERILDPACGSGVFLVDAYRRLAARARRANPGRRLTFDDLTRILLDSVYGVDISPEAIQVAAFSCYLALLDLVEPKSIWTSVRFPRLVGRNLFVSDFFSDEAPFAAQTYTLIIGNPPWKSALTPAARQYVRYSGHPVGDQQVAQAFLWRAGELLSPDGQACLLAPSKGLLFNKWASNLAFRRAFFAQHRVAAVVEFSPFRRSLFQNATGPMAAVFYRPGSVAESDHGVLRYCTPKPSPLSESLAGVVLSGDEIHTFSRRRAVQHPDIWKIALWGSARDLMLIEDLRARFPTLADVERERGWKIGQGVQVGGGGARRAPDLAAMRYVRVAQLEPFVIKAGPDERIGTDIFHRTRDRRIYEAPHVLLRRGLLAGGVISAAYTPFDAVFTDGIIGISGPESQSDELKVLCGYLNSSLSRYYQFLTSASWGVERDEVKENEYLSFPVALPPAKSGPFEDLVDFVDRVQQARASGRIAGGSTVLDELDELVFACYGLATSERQLVLDMLQTIDQFYKGTRSEAFAAPTAGMLKAYSGSFGQVIAAATASSDERVSATVYDGSAPYRVVSFHIGVDDRPSRPTIVVEGRLDEALERLARVEPEQLSDRFFLRRNIKVFERDAVHVVKPAERRYWTRSAAYNDADQTVGQLLRAAALV